MSEQIFHPSELILNEDGTIYHLAVAREHIADTIIIVGDQGRVDKISRYFDRIECKRSNREFETHTGTFNGKRLSVMSTGIGTDNIDIFMNELDAVVNIDFGQRKKSSVLKSLKIIRLGTTGAIHEDIPVGSFIISRYGLGFDGLLHFYKRKEEQTNFELAQKIERHLDLPTGLSKPYVVEASDKIISFLGKDMVRGITATAPGFYGPQDRKLRLQPAIDTLFKRLQSFEYQGDRITNFEMETSALYALGSLLGHQCCTCCVALANRANGTFIEDHDAAVDGLIRVVLERITEMD